MIKVYFIKTISNYQFLMKKYFWASVPLVLFVILGYFVLLDFQKSHDIFFLCLSKIIYLYKEQKSINDILSISLDVISPSFSELIILHS